MKREHHVKTRIIAWNGSKIQVPESWEVRISGHSHLIFEHDFEPLIEIRWEKGNNPTKQYQAVLQKFFKDSSAERCRKKLTEHWQQLDLQYEWTAYSQGGSKTLDGGICRCRSCNSLVFFHLFTRVRLQELQAALCLCSFRCHNESNADVLWSIQDFTLVTPSSYLLTDFTFAAGLTRLSFSAPYTTLHICKLGPASTRLSQQSLKQILIILSGVSELTTKESEDNCVLESFRTPSIPQQIKLRLRREKPFVWAKIWHDLKSDRLLAVVLNSTRPLHQETAQLICKRYEII